MRRAARSIVRAAAAVGVAAFAASAWAQDYAVTTGTAAQYLEARPAGATRLNVTTAAGGPLTTAVTLPFEFPYFGKSVSTAVVSVEGMLVLGATGSISNTDNSTLDSHGRVSNTIAFPYASSGDCNGLVAVNWAYMYYVNDGSAGCGFVYTWTTGAAPDRRFVVSWENVEINNGVHARVTLQCHLYEGLGRIVFAHSGGWTSIGSLTGLDSIIDLRYATPPGLNDTYNYGSTGVDYVFDPRTVTLTGTLRYDRIVSDAGGIGNSVLGDQPLSGCSARLQRLSDGLVYASAPIAPDGTFAVNGVAVPLTGALVVAAENSACRVTASSAGAIATWTVNSSQSFETSANVGTFTLGASADANGDVRAALNVARVCGAVYDWVRARITDVVPRLDSVIDPASTAATAYFKSAGPTPATMRIASPGAPNPDGWDDAVVAHVYGRHVLAAIAGAPTTAYDDRFDAVTDPQNAFAEGFGYFLWAAVSGSTQAIDGTSATTAVVHDLESPAISATKGPDVAGCVAGALYDLLDPANEATDPVDGSSTTDRVLRAAAAMTSAPKSGTFLTAWIAAGYDAPGATRAFISNFALVDDASEPNDSVGEAPSLGPVGFPPKTYLLNRFNEDWFSVTLPAAAASLAADAKYDAVATGATVAVEIRDSGGSLLATGTLVPATGAVHAATDAVTAGTYKIGVKHVSGGTVPAYALQAYVPPSMDAAPIHDWTVGRNYDIAVGVRDGIAPYTLSTPSSEMPPGLGLSSSTLYAIGRPTTAGPYVVTVQAKDSGNPPNLAQVTQVVVIHDVFKLPIAPFVGFAAGKSVDATLPTRDGTPPYSLSTSYGALTPGLAFAPNSLHVVGTATAGPSSAFGLAGIDLAGSSDHVATRAVVAVEITGKKIPANLVAGVDACGWWFDAVEGSTATFAVATGKGMPKRALKGAFLAPDRSLVTTGKIVGRLGGVSASRLVCPQSGRYYFVASSADVAGLATQLVGTATVKLPKAGKGLNRTFAPSATTTIEFGAVPGSTATVKFAGDKKATLVAKVVAVYDPTGAQISSAGLVKPTALGGTLTLPLPVGGTWTVVLGATSQTGKPGKLSYSYALKQSKDAVYSAE